MKKTITAAILVLLSASVCLAQKRIAIEHNYSAFTEVVAGDHFNISIIPSEESRVRITTDVRTENYILAYVKDGILYLSVDENAMPADIRKEFKARNPVLALPDVEIYSPSLKSVSLTGNSVIACDSLVTADSFTLTLSKSAAVRKMNLKAEKVSVLLNNRSQAYMTITAGALNLQCTHNTIAEMKIDTDRLTAYADSFSSVELFDNADSIALSTEGNSKIVLDSQE